MSWHPFWSSITARSLLDHHVVASRQTIELIFENRVPPPNTARSSDRLQGLTAVAEGRPSPGGGPLGDEGPWGSTSRARGSRSKRGRTGPGAARRRGLLLPGSRRRHRARGNGRTGSGQRRCTIHGRRCAIHRHRYAIRGRPEPRRPPHGARAGHAGHASTTGACACSLPDRTASWPTLSGMPQAQPGTRSVRALRFRTESGKRAALLRRSGGAPAATSGQAAPRQPESGRRASAQPHPDDRRRLDDAVPAVALRGKALSAWPRTRARRPRCPAPPPHRCCRPARRRPTGSR